MPWRPDPPQGLNLSRLNTTPVKLPRMTFPMIGGVPESAPPPAGPTQQLPPAPVETAIPRMPQEGTAVESTQMRLSPAPMSNAAPVQAAQQANTASRVIIYGRSGCEYSMRAIQDLIERQVSFQYVDVSRDTGAMSYLQTIMGGEVVVPVIIQIGFGGT